MERFPQHLYEKLLRRHQEHSFRELPEENFLFDFDSNDYLGFSRSEVLKEETERLWQSFGGNNGATGSRLISGNFPLIRQAEAFVADFHQVESALFFTSGYTANVGFFSCVPQRGDVVLYDALIHASIRDGIQMGRAQSYKFEHCSLEDLEQKLIHVQGKFKSVFVVTESVFSMDGDAPDLLAVLELCEKYEAFLIVDEAHSLGVFGDRGEGKITHLGIQHRVFATIVTYGKALGSHGACLLSGKKLRDYLINFCRAFIYTTGLSPHSVAQIWAAYRLLPSTDAREKLYQCIEFFKTMISQSPWKGDFIPSHSAIQSLVIGGNERTRQMAHYLQCQDFAVKAILSPTVEEGRERIRFCLHSYNETHHIETLFEHLKKYI